MKKLLALVLALVMTLSLCTISNAKYSDAADVDYKEAVDVMSLVGVFQGADGKFSPKANLTREQAAKLIAYLDLGETVAEALPAVKVFSDVEANRWSAKYIAYCADAGYINGVGEGKFNPAGELTGYAFGKMLLCVLGYDASIEEFTGSNWTIKVAKLMESNDIADDVAIAASAVLTREAAAQYCLNTIQQRTVTYGSKGTSIKINGAEIATGASAASKKTDGVDNALLKDKLYKKSNGDPALTVDTAAVDDFNRIGDQWTYVTAKKTSKTDVFAAEAAYTFVAEKAIEKADDSFDTLIAGVNKALDFTKTSDKLTKNFTKAYINGVDTASKDFAVAIGDVVEVFAKDGKISNIVVKNYTLGEISKVDTDVKESDADNDVTAYVTLEGVATYNDTDFAGFNADTYKKDTKVAYIVKGDEVIDSYVATVVSGVSFTSKASDGKTAVANSTTYTAYNKAANFFNTVKVGSDNSYDLYVDANGYVLGFEAVKTEKTLNDVYYVIKNFTKTADQDEYGQTTNYGYVQVTNLKGEISTVVVEDAATATGLVGKLVTFAKVAKKDYMAATEYKTNDDYTVKAVSSATLKTSSKTLDGQYLNADSQYVVVTNKTDMKKTTVSVKVGGVAYTGVNGYVISHKSGTAYVVDYVVFADGSATKATYEDKLYVKSGSSYSVYNNDDGNYNVFTVYAQDGSKKDINVGSTTALTAGFNTYETDSDDVYTLTHNTVKTVSKATVWTKDFVGTLEGASFTSYFGGLLNVVSNTYDVTEIAAASAVVVDLHDTAASGQYTKTVSDLETLDTLVNGTAAKVASATMSLDIDEDGAVVIFITSVVAK